MWRPKPGIIISLYVAAELINRYSSVREGCRDREGGTVYKSDLFLAVVSASPEVPVDEAGIE